MANGLPTGCGLLAARTKPARIVWISRKHIYYDAVFLYYLVDELLQHRSPTDIQILKEIKIKQKRKIMTVSE